MPILSVDDDFNRALYARRLGTRAVAVPLHYRDGQLTSEYLGKPKDRSEFLGGLLHEVIELFERQTTVGVSDGLLVRG